MSDTKYNGWTNFETWKVNLELLDGVTAEDLFGRKCDAEEIKEYIWTTVTEEYPKDKSYDFAMSCVVSVLHAVNWHEIAEHLNED